MKNILKSAAAAAAAMIVTAVSASAVIIKADETIPAAPAEEITMSSIGSVSKMFGTAAAMQLVDEGKLELDAPVTDYLPDFRMDDSRYKDITIRMLLSHTSGLMGTTGEDFMLFDDIDPAPHDELLSKISKQKLKADPGEFAAYCNDGFTLLELVIEEVSGESFAEYVEKHICDPLGLTYTGTALGRAFRSPYQADVFSSYIKLPADYCMASASGGVISTAEELSRFGKSFFTGNTELISESSKNEMKKKNIDKEYEGGFGLGWDTVEDKDYEAAGVQVVAKGGDLNFQHASLVVAPDEDISVSVLTSGGNSGCNELFAKALLDIALEEKGIKVEHTAVQPKELLTEVPEKYLALEDIYADSSSIYRITFPDRKYMRVENLCSDITSVNEFMYTTEDSFVLMDGKVESGRAVQAKDQTVLKVTSYNGKDCFVYEQYMDQGILGAMSMDGYLYMRVGENKVSDEVQKAWEARNGRKYYIYTEKYSSVMYMADPLIKLSTVPDVPGYTNIGAIVDSDRITYCASFPGTRDLETYTIIKDGDVEKMKAETSNITAISEESIPVLEEEMNTIALRTKNAAWYKIGESLGGKVKTLDIPDKAAVYIYDRFDNLCYSSYMDGYGNNVVFPENGKIVFLGEDGGKVTFS